MSNNINNTPDYNNNQEKLYAEYKKVKDQNQDQDQKMITALRLLELRNEHSQIFAEVNSYVYHNLYGNSQYVSLQKPLFEVWYRIITPLYHNWYNLIEDSLTTLVFAPKSELQEEILAKTKLFAIKLYVTKLKAELAQKYLDMFKAELEKTKKYPEIYQQLLMIELEF